MGAFAKPILVGILCLTLVVEIKLIFDGLHEDQKSSDAISVQFLGSKSEWSFRYAGPDGTFDTPDDRFLGPENLIFPLGATIKFFSSSKDLVYCFEVRDLNIAQLVIPGQPDSVEVELDELGSFELNPCQFCGIPNHYYDRELRVVSPEEYNRWLAKK